MTKNLWKKISNLLSPTNHISYFTHMTIHTHLDLNTCTRTALPSWLNINVLWRWMLLCQTLNIYRLGWFQYVVCWRFSCSCIAYKIYMCARWCDVHMYVFNRHWNKLWNHPVCTIHNWFFEMSTIRKSLSMEWFNLYFSRSLSRKIKYIDKLVIHAIWVIMGRFLVKKLIWEIEREKGVLNH